MGSENQKPKLIKIQKIESEARTYHCEISCIHKLKWEKVRTSLFPSP